jgi:hypothetical protein
MNDDWRLRVTMGARVQAADLGQQLSSGSVEHSLESGAGDRVAVSVDGDEVFVYAGTREQAARASDAITSLASARGWTIASTELRRWHPAAEEWEDPDAPLPSSPSELAAEHEELVESEREESARYGFSEYEVRIDAHTHRDTVTLAARLRDEGYPVLRRWKYLLIGAADEDSAQALADRLQPELPPGGTLTVEASLAAIEAETPPNPFAWFGGLGG